MDEAGTSTWNSTNVKYSVYGLSSFLLLNSVISIIGNALVLIVFYVEKPCQGSLRVLLSHLAASNLIMALFGQPMVIISGYCGKWMFGKAGRYIEGFLVTVTGLVAMALTAVLAYERLSRLTCIFRSTFTERKAKLVSRAIWVFQVGYCIIPFFGVAEWVPEGIGITNSILWNKDSVADVTYIAVMMFTGYFLPLVIVIICYVKLISLVKKSIESTISKDELKLYYQSKTISITSAITKETNVDNEQDEIGKERSSETVSLAMPSNLASTDSNMPLPDKIIVDRIMKTKRLEKQLVLVVALIIAAFFISWTPYAIVNILVTIDKSHIGTEKIYATLPAIFAKTSTVWSPLIYFFINSEIKKTSRHFLRKVKIRLRVMYFGGKVSKEGASGDSDVEASCYEVTPPTNVARCHGDPGTVTTV